MLPECLEDLMLHTGAVQVYPFSGFKNITNGVSSGLSQMLSADGKWDSNCYFTESCLEMQQVIPALILRGTWHSDPFSPTLFLISRFIFFFPEQGLLSLMAVCANESAQHIWCFDFSPMFLSQVLHSNFVLLKPVVKTVVGWLCWSSHPQLTAERQIILREPQPHLTQELNLVQSY